MKIGEIEKLTGLTSKAIRLYEEKGLISVGRGENGYREYDRAALNRLKSIKLLRHLGIGLSEIELYFNSVVTLRELIDKRKSQLENESVANKENYLRCIELLNSLNEERADITEEVTVINEAEAVVGIDVGTTTVSTVVANIKTGEVIKSYTVDNASKLSTPDGFFEYDPDITAEKCLAMARYLKKAYPNIRSIGVTGQMHGVLYTDKHGCAVSPLYNWQDCRANELIEENRSYCDKILELTGYSVYSGYGFATLYYNRINSVEPENAFSFCTLPDYIVMKLTGRKTPLIHSTNAASLGLFNIKKNEFDSAALYKLGLSWLEEPTVVSDCTLAGSFDGVPVCVAIGDNQASFFGTVGNEKNTALVNFGTGSQISVPTDSADKVFEDLEVRPHLFGNYLLCGCALCGGRAYSVLEKFFASYAELLGVDRQKQYENMNLLAEKAYGTENRLKVSSQLCGTRNHPELRGSVTNISDSNFTPENLVLGMLYGMAGELKEYFDKMNLPDISRIVASGNAVQKNKVLQWVLADTFGCEIAINQRPEEAALGAALFSALLM